MSEQDAAPAQPVRLKFDDGPTDDMPLDKAESVLRHVREHAPQAWANAMLATFAPGFKATKNKANGKP